MIKNTLAILTLLLSLNLSAQTISYNVSGGVKNPGKAKFVYLTTLQQIIRQSDDRIFMVQPITDKNFEFKGTYDLKGKDYQPAFIFVDQRGNISLEELKSKLRNIVIVAEAENNFRLLMLENLKLSINNDVEVKTSTVTEGGKLTKQVDERNQAMRQGAGKLVNFVSAHAGSLVALAAVEEVADGVNASNKDKLGAIWGTPMQLYNQLSPALKSSKRGIAVKKKILAKQSVK
jgi:hypothetical protein